ncbi:unnamed protein product, partial [Urochloa humidicola]
WTGGAVTRRLPTAWWPGVPTGVLRSRALTLKGSGAAALVGGEAPGLMRGGASGSGCGAGWSDDAEAWQARRQRPMVT